ncbi:hypothetical protein F1880_005909 [Penicillium rolfsii]|nr:hypothetical protein F1880_005909 [Penicillium rolfsii]
MNATQWLKAFSFTGVTLLYFQGSGDAAHGAEAATELDPTAVLVEPITINVGDETSVLQAADLEVGVIRSIQMRVVPCLGQDSVITPMSWAEKYWS